jgi:hypothetical protein
MDDGEHPLYSLYTVLTIHCAVLTIHCTHYTLCCTHYTLHSLYTVLTIHCTVLTIHCTALTIHCTVLTMHCTYYALYSLCTVLILQVSIHTVLAIHSLYTHIAGEHPHDCGEPSQAHGHRDAEITRWGGCERGGNGDGADRRGVPGD